MLFLFAPKNIVDFGNKEIFLHCLTWSPRRRAQLFSVILILQKPTTKKNKSIQPTPVRKLFEQHISSSLSFNCLFFLLKKSSRQITQKTQRLERRNFFQERQNHSKIFSSRIFSCSFTMIMDLVKSRNHDYPSAQFSRRHHPYSSHHVIDYVDTDYSNNSTPSPPIIPAILDYAYVPEDLEGDPHFDEEEDDDVFGTSLEASAFYNGNHLHHHHRGSNNIMERRHYLHQQRKNNTTNYNRIMTRASATVSSTKNSSSPGASAPVINLMRRRLMKPGNDELLQPPQQQQTPTHLDLSGAAGTLPHHHHHRHHHQASDVESAILEESSRGNVLLQDKHRHHHHHHRHHHQSNKQGMWSGKRLLKAQIIAIK